MKKVVFSLLITALLGAVIFMYNGFFKTAMANASVTLHNLLEKTDNISDLNQSYTELYGKYQEQIFENRRLKKYSDENEKLRSLLELKQSVKGKIVAAEVISFGNNEDFKYMLANKGTNDGISPGDCVISSEGFAGIVTECANSWCGIKTLMSEELDMSVTDTENGKTYLMNCGELEFVSLGDDVGFGDLLVTSGVSKNIPKGLKVGRVFTVKDGNGAEQSVKVTPCTNYSRIEYILILTEN